MTAAPRERRRRTSTASVAAKVGWKSNTADGVYLEKILKSGKVAPGITPRAFQEQFPRYMKYERKSFGAALRRFKNKAGLMVRNPKKTTVAGSIFDDDDGMSFGTQSPKTKNTSATVPEDDEDASSFDPVDEDLSEDEETVKLPTTITASVGAPSAGGAINAVAAGNTPKGANPIKCLVHAYQLNVDQWKPPIFKMKVEDFHGDNYYIITVLLPSSVGNDETSKGLWRSHHCQHLRGATQ